MTSRQLATDLSEAAEIRGVLREAVHVCPPRLAPINHGVWKVTGSIIRYFTLGVFSLFLFLPYIGANLTGYR